MGPRTGSPAAEAQNVVFIRFLLMGACLLAGVPFLAQAATDEVSHQVTVVVVHPSLSFSGSEDASLNFKSTRAGSESSSQTVDYWVKSNNAPAVASEGVLTATIRDLPEGILLQADSGPFRNHGPAGGAKLTESASGFQTIVSPEQPVSLADKASSTGYGSGGSILMGKMPVTWKATATENLSTDKEQSIPVIVTLKES